MLDNINDKERRFIELALLVTIFILLLLVYKVSLIKKEQNTVNTDSIKLVIKEIDYQEINEEELKNIIENELYILNKKNSISEITNQDKLSLARNLLGNPDTFTKTDLEETFNKSCISNLGIDTNDDITTSDSFNESIVLSKNYLSLNNDNGKYKVSVGYLWSEPVSDINAITKVYGKNNEELYTIPEDILVSDDRFSNISNWINDNFDLFKNELDIYNYVFIKQDGKISLVDFYRN